MPVVIRYSPTFKRWYVCHAKSYQNAFPSQVNGFLTWGGAVHLALENDCVIEYHADDQLQHHE